MLTQPIRPSLIPVWMAALIGAVGCTGESQRGAEWDGIVRDSAGVILVENFGSPLWGDEDRWTISEVLRIGTVEGEPEYQFGRITGFGVLSDGRVVVADAHAQNLRFFSPEGVHERTVGKAGSGPREFGSRNLGVLVALGDTLLVQDWGNFQAHAIAPDGRWLNSWRFAPEGGWVTRGWDDAPTGRVVTLMTPLRIPDSPVADTLDLVLIRDVRGAVLDTLARVPTTRMVRVAGDAPEWHLWAGDPDFDLTWQGGLVTGRSDEYRLQSYDENGNLERIIRLSRAKEPITDRDRSRMMDQFDRMMRNMDLPPAEVAQLKSAVHFEDSYPAWRSFICGAGGTVWVQRLRPVSALSEEELESLGFGGPPPATPEWDVFDGQGRYLGVMVMPTSGRAFRFVGDRIYGIWEDELDVQHIVAWRIDGLPPPELD